jgi:hypothetical protein
MMLMTSGFALPARMAALKAETGKSGAPKVEGNFGKTKASERLWGGSVGVTPDSDFGGQTPRRRHRQWTGEQAA